MSTLVQIKRSSANAAPDSLSAGELAYSYVSNVIFIGDTATGVMNIGGQYYTELIDQGTAANSASTFVRREANGSAQFSQLDILVAPTANSHVATKEYVDNAIIENISLSDLSDVSIPGLASDQNNRILIGHANGEFISTNVTGNVSLSNTGVFTIGNGQVINSMLVNSNVSVTAGAGLVGGGTVDLGSTITIDVNAGDGISNSVSDTVSVDGTVVRTDRNQTLNGFMTFSNTVYITADLDVTGNIFVSGNTSYINVETLRVDDSLIYLAANNTVSDLVDIGLFGSYNDGVGHEHTGLVRHAADKTWYLFDDLFHDPESNIVDVANSTYALLKANLEAKSLLVTGSGSVANINTTLDVTGNTAFKSNVTVNDSLIVDERSEANVFISNRQVVEPPNLLNFDGERLRLFDFDEAGRPNYAIGVEGNHIWMGVDSSANNQGFKWYGNTSLAMRLSGNGVLEIANSINVVNIVATNLTLTSPLGVSSGGTGLNSFTANGVFFADTSSTLSFATGTEGEVLQITSGVPTFAMLDGGSF